MQFEIGQTVYEAIGSSWYRSGKVIGTFRRTGYEYRYSYVEDPKGRYIGVQTESPLYTCQECEGMGYKGNHLTGLILCSKCEGMGKYRAEGMKKYLFNRADIITDEAGYSKIQAEKAARHRQQDEAQEARGERIKNHIPNLVAAIKEALETGGDAELAAAQYIASYGYSHSQYTPGEIVLAAQQVRDASHETASIPSFAFTNDLITEGYTSKVTHLTASGDDTP